MIPTWSATIVKALPVIVRLPLWYTIVSTTCICSSSEYLSKSIIIFVFLTSLNCCIPILMSEIPARSKPRRSMRNFRTCTKLRDLILADPSTTKKMSWGVLLQSGVGIFVAENLKRWWREEKYTTGNRICYWNRLKVLLILTRLHYRVFVTKYNCCKNVVECWFLFVAIYGK